ncbi:hypothetical protein ACWC9H_13295 [Streptomyces sp. NPDC001251]
MDIGEAVAASAGAVMAMLPTTSEAAIAAFIILRIIPRFFLVRRHRFPAKCKIGSSCVPLELIEACAFGQWLEFRIPARLIDLSGIS